MLVAIRKGGDKGDWSEWGGKQGAAMMRARMMRPAVLLLGQLAAAVLPPRCPGCGVPVEADHRFCATCWASLRFIGPPWCAACNMPFVFDRGTEARCADCLDRAPAHAGVRAAVAYGPVARTLALRLKYGRRTGLAATAARSMRRLVPDGTELLIPVPLHRWRLWSRGYNQAALIASALSALGAGPVDAEALARIRHTAPLCGVGGRKRARAMAGAFAVRDPARVRGRSIVLVDDIYTSGATAAACTRVLLGAGARSVTILCWARVLADD